jgi:metal-sulfur cluster biosynthetic enzyme
MDILAAAPNFAYTGPEAMRQPVVDALRRVVDPELSLGIVDIGLVYDVTLGPQRWQVEMTMTSPACPVTGLILEEVEAELSRVAPAGTDIEVDLVWEPPWTPERLSARAKVFLGW